MQNIKNQSQLLRKSVILYSKDLPSKKRTVKTTEPVESFAEGKLAEPVESFAEGKLAEPEPEPEPTKKKRTNKTFIEKKKAAKDWYLLIKTKLKYIYLLLIKLEWKEKEIKIKY